jgi:transcriptional regulator with XRE-family HTH domain
MIHLTQKTSSQIALETAARVRLRRKEQHLTQEQLAEKAGMSFGSYKRFEQKGEIAFDSLVKIAVALGMENGFNALFAKKQFSSLRELINEQDKNS